MLATIITACSRKTVATHGVVVSESREATAPETPKPSLDNTGVNLVAAGKNVYEIKCTKCHGAKATDVYTSERWDGILKMMVPKARLTDSETEQVTAYVNARRIPFLLVAEQDKAGHNVQLKLSRYY